MSRGNRKATIFDDANDRRIFLNTFEEVTRDYRPRVYAGCLMGTHYHLLLDTPRGNLSDFMRQLNSVYSTDYNRRHARVGHTFEQRFQSVVVQEEEYLRRVARYIVLNPVRAGLCRHPADWPWTTYRATAGLEAAPPWLYLDWLESAFRQACRREAQQAYQRYVSNPKALEWAPDANETVIGTKRFKRTALKAHLRATSNRPLPGGRVRSTRPLSAVFDGWNGDRRLRNELILEAHATHGYRLGAIATFLGIHASTASKAIKRARREG